MFTVMVVSALILTSAPTRPVMQMPLVLTLTAASRAPATLASPATASPAPTTTSAPTTHATPTPPAPTSRAATSVLVTKATG